MMRNTIRAFIACPLPEDIRARLAVVEQILAQSGADVKWVVSENLHLTLRFLGERPPKRIQVIRQGFREAFAGCTAIPTSLDHAGSFPFGKTPRIVWAGFGLNASRIAQLAETVEGYVNRCGLPKTGQTFHPHITLGRVRNARHSDALQSVLKSVLREDPLPVRLERVDLMQSVLTNREPVYDVLESMTLKD